jgi:hypothetical protein
VSANKNLPANARNKGKDVSLKNPDTEELTPIGTVQRLPIRQCVWIIDCIVCSQQLYADHKPEGITYLVEHYEQEHSA